MFHSFRPTSHVTYQSTPNGILVGALPKTVFRTIRHILLLRHYCLIAKHSITLCPGLPGRLFVGLIAEANSPSLLLPRKPNRFVAIRIRGLSSRCNFIDLGFCHFPIIFGLDCGQEVTPIFMIQGMIVLLIILQIILHG